LLLGNLRIAAIPKIPQLNKIRVAGTGTGAAEALKTKVGEK
jgi:hypothetical protein